MSMETDLKIKEEYHDRTFTTLSIEGLSVEEMHQILDVSHASLEEILDKHGLVGTYKYWRDGFGIYGIRHVGGHLFVTIGNSCD